MTKEDKTIKELKRVNHKLKHQYELLEIRENSLRYKYEELTNDLEREKSQVKEYGTRLIKAIEYIEKNCILSDTWKDLDFCNFVPVGKIKYKPLSSKKVKDLSDILKGVELTENDKKQIKWLKEEFKVGVDKE